MSRAYTEEEIRDMFLKQVAGLALYWATLKPNLNSPIADDRREKTPLERCNGLAFSILSLIDGSSIAMPGVHLSIQPHPDDKAYHQTQGDSWFEPGMVFNADDALHELWHKYERAE